MTDQMGVQNETVAESQEPVNQEQQTSEQSNWQAARETMAQQKQELEQLKQQNQLLQRWAEQQNQAQQTAQSVNPFEGMSVDDVMTVGDFQGVFNKALEQKENAFRQEMASIQKEQKLMNYRSQYKDYDDVIQNTLKKAETNPALAQAIASSQDPHLLAYEIGRSDLEYQRKQKAEAERILANANKPGSVSNASTGGSALSAVDHIMNMSDQDFEAKIAAIKRGA